MNDQPSPDVPPIGPSQPIGVTENDIRQRSQELGILGKLFGSRDHAPINIAGGLMVLGIVAMVLVPMLPESANFSKGDLEADPE
jgi:hypothetical protein